MQSKDSREVNTLLHTLRGEQFRHLQNVRQSRSHIVSRSRNYNVPTLPIRLAATETYESDLPSGTPKPAEDPGLCPGPAPPKSWRAQPQPDVHDTPTWRAQALSPIASHMGNFPSLNNQVPALTLLCLQLILSKCTNSTEFREDIVPYIPDHLRRDLVRHCAIHAPLPSWKLDALYEPEGHADGEIIVVGPTSNIRDDHFIQNTRLPSTLHNESDEEWNWESDDRATGALSSLVLLTTSLPTSTLLTIPPTLKTLALLNLSSHIPLHRLPSICPLLVLLDISHNSWLREPVGEGYKSLQRVEWTRWSYLKVLGLRDCHIGDGLQEKVNKGRWEDVEIIQ